MCPHEEKVTAWLLGDLPPDAQQAMTQHLAACAACRSQQAELAAVLTPLRSGLAKDRSAALPERPLPQSHVAAPSRQGAWPPHTWLRRAALLAVSLGILFIALALVQMQSVRARKNDGVVTHMTFRRDGEPQVPALSPVPQPAPSVRTPDMADFKPDMPPPALDGALVSSALPTGHPNIVRLPGLIEPRNVAAADRAVAHAYPTISTSAPPAEIVTQTGRPKDGAREIPPPPPHLRIKPVLLVGRPPASTAPTNNPPTSEK
jgi:hypothetical protein